MINRSRRDLLKQLKAMSATIVLQSKTLADPFGKPIDSSLALQVATVSAHTVRLMVFASTSGKPDLGRSDGSLVRESWPPPVLVKNGSPKNRVIESGKPRIRTSLDPLSIAVAGTNDVDIQTLSIDRTSGEVSFATGDAPRSYRGAILVDCTSASSLVRRHISLDKVA